MTRSFFYMFEFFLIFLFISYPYFLFRLGPYHKLVLWAEFSNSNLSGTGIFLYFNQDNYTLSPSHQPIQTNLHRKLKYSLCLIISNETSLHLQQLKRATYNMLWFIERNPCFHIYRNVSDCYRWKHTRYSVYEVNVMLRERFGLGHRSSPARVITKPSCLSDGR